MNSQIIVTYHDGSLLFYPISSERGGWKIDATIRCIVIGHGVPRVYVPLDQVRSFEICRVGGDLYGGRP